MNNQEFIKVISNSFKAFIECGTSRSTAKLKPLHGAIAKDISERLGNNYSVLSQGFADDKEGSITGRYINKKVDILIKRDNDVYAGIAVKFVMQNYSQNSNNYFENMLGETANIRSNNYPYFQIFIIIDTLPYYNRNKVITKWEHITNHNLEKYLKLSKDDNKVFFHIPNKTLIFIVSVPINEKLKTLDEYRDFHKTTDEIAISKKKYKKFGSSVILNDYEKFIEKIYHTILSL